jgi:hypothetical protein
MTIMLKSSDVQQNFGRVVEQALTQDDVVVERYGEPRVAILNYQRYQQLLQLEQTTLGVHIVPPDYSAEAQQKGLVMADAIRQKLREELDGSLEEVMATLRGRSWS